MIEIKLNPLDGPLDLSDIIDVLHSVGRRLPLVCLPSKLT